MPQEEDRATDMGRPNIHQILVKIGHVFREIADRQTDTVTTVLRYRGYSNKLIS